MDCPRCRTSLIVVEHHDVELDWCPDCAGLWFNRGELELLALRLGSTVDLSGLSSESNSREKKLRCPECNRPMEKRTLRPQQPIIVDACQSCGGLWLDHGELEQLIEADDARATLNPIAQQLQDTFSHTFEQRSIAPGD